MRGLQSKGQVRKPAMRLRENQGSEPEEPELLPYRHSMAAHSMGLQVLGESLALSSCQHFSQKVPDGSGSLGRQLRVNFTARQQPRGHQLLQIQGECLQFPLPDL